MLIRTTAPVAEASGKQGTDIVFFAWRGAQCARDYARPQNPNTPRQIAVRNALSIITKRWKTLSTSDRESWAAYAANNKIKNRLGVEVTSTSLGCYLAINSMKYLLAGSYQDSAPIGASPAPPTEISALELDPDTALVVSISHPAITAGQRLVVYFAVPASPAVRLSESVMTLATYPATNSSAPGVVAATSTQVALPLDELAFTPQVGMLVHVGARILSSDYQPSRMLIQPATVAAI